MLQSHRTLEIRLTFRLQLLLLLPGSFRLRDLAIGFALLRGRCGRRIGLSPFVDSLERHSDGTSECIDISSPAEFRGSSFPVDLDRIAVEPNADNSFLFGFCEEVVLGCHSAGRIDETEWLLSEVVDGVAKQQLR